MDHDWYETQRQKILSDYASLEPAIRASLTRAREEFPAAGDNEETWEEWQQNEQLRRETMRYAAEKAAIAQDLTALKATVRQLLDANETRPEMERLPVSAFDLDLASREARLKAAEDERAEVRAELERLCASTASVADWIKATYWEPQIVLGRSIFSFRGDTEVTNYPLTEEDPYFKDHLRWAQFSRESTRGIIDGDTFQPWRVYTAEELQTELSKPVTVYREDDRRRMDVFLEEEEREIDPDELAEMRVFDGKRQRFSSFDSMQRSSASNRNFYTHFYTLYFARNYCFACLTRWEKFANNFSGDNVFVKIQEIFSSEIPRLRLERLGKCNGLP